MEAAGLEAKGEQEASTEEAPEREAEHTSGEEEEEQQEVPARPRQPENEVSEVEIPNVGRIMVRADADGYNEEVSSHISLYYMYLRLHIFGVIMFFSLSFLR